MLDIMASYKIWVLQHTKTKTQTKQKKKKTNKQNISLFYVEKKQNKTKQKTVDQKGLLGQ